MWFWLLVRTWFSQITAVVWLVLAFVSFVRTYLRSELDRWGKVVRSSSAKIE